MIPLKLFISLFFLIPLCLPAQANWIQVGDMILPESFLLKEGDTSRGVMQSRVRPWPNGTLPYSFARDVSQTNRNLFLRSCRELENYADVRCIARSSADRNYVYVTNSRQNHCGSSYLGTIGGRQQLTIRCWQRDVVLHELLHAFGMSHEHNRRDRDQYITMLWQNISNEVRPSFRKLSVSTTQAMISQYDYDSIMHYDSYAGASSFGSPAFYRTDLGPSEGLIGPARDLSFSDKYFLSYLYGEP